jgi:hypothetical protein
MSREVVDDEDDVVLIDGAACTLPLETFNEAFVVDSADIVALASRD